MNNIRVVLIIILMLSLGISGFLSFKYWGVVEENQQLQSDIVALNNTNQEILGQVDQLAGQISILGQEQEQFKEDIEILQKRSSIICSKDNSCKFRTPGSTFRCDQDSKYDGDGDYFCECTLNCEVRVK